ncbi:hypothetical protein RJT34_17907 [Clitoria ternatea]|uniref:Uncharacterized protein n=1 Tax=Clitoria ternatea TaxID=43366 RepID=A0AAN9JB20_CLITE
MLALVLVGFLACQVEVLLSMALPTQASTLLLLMLNRLNKCSITMFVSCTIVLQFQTCSNIMHIIKAGNMILNSSNFTVEARSSEQNKYFKADGNTLHPQLHVDVDGHDTHCRLPGFRCKSLWAGQWNCSCAGHAVDVVAFEGTIYPLPWVEGVLVIA